MSGIEPLMFVAAAAQLAGGVMGYQGSREEMDMADRNATAARREAASIAEVEAAEGRVAAGRARARAGASGLTVADSAADVIGALAAAGEFNARSALYQGRRRVQQFRADKASARRRGHAALLSAVSNAGSTLTAGLKGDGGAAGSSQSAAPIEYRSGTRRPAGG